MKNQTLSTELQQLITPEQAWLYYIIPKEITEKTIQFWISENVSENLIDELELLFGKTIILEKILHNDCLQLLGKFYRKHQEQTISTLTYEQSSTNFLQKLIQDAKNLNSSDIHIEIYEKRCRVRIRIDGKLVEKYVIENTEYPALINKIKIMAHLDISEKRLPQDGRIFFESYQSKFDIRVSILPTLHGEKIVLRLLNNDATNIDIQKLGFQPSELAYYLEGIKKTNGIILISGPTGSGKTTTLYATLKLLNEESSNIVTIEDPIEYTLEGINQVQLKESIGLNFASALRTFLRQDPDVIMLGEIRDAETAQMAIRASLTGHLVLSTIHTNSAWGTVSRLVDMGIPPYLVANTLNLTIAQRLIRLLCPECKQMTDFDEKNYPIRFKAPQKITQHYVPGTCAHCHYTGYKGRKAIYEVIPIDLTLSEFIKNRNFEINEYLKEHEIHTLTENAFALFAEGKTSLEEIYPLLLTF